MTGYNVYIGTTKVASPGTTSYTFSSLTCGTTYTLGVEALDAAGNTSSVSSLAASSGSCPDTTPPTVSLTAPAAGSSIAGTVTVTANATDAGGVGSVRFTLDGTSLGAVDTTAPYQVAWDTTMFADGTHTLPETARPRRSRSQSRTPRRSP